MKPFRTNILLPKELYKDLKRALQRRQTLAAASGQEIPASVSAWVREKARETIQAFK